MSINVEYIDVHSIQYLHVLRHSTFVYQIKELLFNLTMRCADNRIYFIRAYQIARDRFKISSVHREESLPSLRRQVCVRHLRTFRYSQTVSLRTI